MNVVPISAGGARRGADAAPAGAARQSSRLWRSAEALRRVRGWGLSDATIRRFELGLKEPYVSRGTGLVTDHALAFPIMGSEGWVPNRFAYLNLEGLTANPGHPVGWGPGLPLTAFSRRPFAGASLVLVDSVVRMWLLAQLLDRPGTPVVVACRSHPGGLPPEWLTERFWSGWSRVTLALDDAGGDEALARTIASRAAVPVHALSADDMSLLVEGLGGGMAPAAARGLLSAAGPWSPRSTLAAGTAEFAPVATPPLVLDGAYHRGRMYHPVTMERSMGGDAPGEVLSSYVVRVLRSDGLLLDVATLPHPAGTAAADRVVALSDGTRILQPPRPSPHGSWRPASIASFVTARAAGREPERRALAAILGDVERHLRASAWLPDPDAYAVLALFVAAGYVHRVFEALPILLLNGPAGSGKSELGAAIAAVGLNGMVVGQVSGAGLIRLIDEVRGVLVVDDLEAIAGSSTTAAAEIGQVLKCSYKQSTARKAIPGRGGRIRMFDFYGPKVVSNIGGVGAVLGTRMLAIRTAPMSERPDVDARPRIAVDDLRDELHVWAMCEAPDVDAACRSSDGRPVGRSDEIAAPLRALAALSGDPGYVERLERWLAGSAAPAEVAPSAARPDPSASLGRALGALRERGVAGSVSLTQIQLELALLNAGVDDVDGDAVSAETIGRLLLSIGARRPDVPVERRRLHGVITRIYALAGAAEGGPDRDALAFCAEGGCGTCPYAGVCDAAVPGLRAAKSRRGSI